MFDKKDKDNVCYCETCGHKKATECITIQCSCCIKADRIRLEHLIIPEDDFRDKDQEAEEREKADVERKKEELDDMARAQWGFT